MSTERYADALRAVRQAEHEIRTVALQEWNLPTSSPRFQALLRWADALREATAALASPVEAEPSMQFPIMGEPKTSIPWAVIAPHEAWARRNHWQSLKVLADRGGLDASEAVSVIEERPWRRMDDAEARRRLAKLVAAGPVDYKALYFELLYQVATKHPGETRHETARRYIRQAETPAAPDPSQEPEP